MIQKKIERITRSPLHQGFLGKGHLAAAVIDGNDFSRTDPFIILMDDQLDLPGGEPVGGAHPHAGFETVTFVLEGDEEHFKTGSLEIMTAGKGIIHTEEISGRVKMRILQLWLALPKEKRWAEPRWQLILEEAAPKYTTDKVSLKVYSGSSNGVTSPMQNHTPLTLVDFSMRSDATVSQVIPTERNSFIFVVDGEVWIGDRKVSAGESAWLDNSAEESEVRFETKATATRFILYSALPHNVPIVNHGPFIGDTQDDIRRLFHEYNSGQMVHLNDLDEGRKFRYEKAQV
jgi:redox-sensitive bicupin YhaK (pirin superfamily)